MRLKPNASRALVAITTAVALLFPGCEDTAHSQNFRSAWPKTVTRTWVGPAYWSNPLQDWRVAGGRLECVTSGGNRNVALLTRRLGAGKGDLRMSVRLGALEEGKFAGGWVGFRLGAKGRLWRYPELADYRDDALRGVGLHAGITTAGELFIGRPMRRASASVGIPRGKWKIHSVSSQHNTTTEAGRSAIDGDPTTFWHGAYGPEGGKYPHELVLDLGEAVGVRGIGYLPRQDQSTGRIKEYELYVGAEAGEWGQPVATGQFADSQNLQRVTFGEKRGRYVRLVAKSGVVGDRPACAVAELYVMDAKTVTSPPNPRPAAPAVDLREVELRLTARPDGDAYRVTLSGHDAGGRQFGEATRSVKPDDLVGALALVCDWDPSLGQAGGRRRGGTGRGGNVRFWFRDWTVGGSKVEAHDDRAFGPILWSQYTLSRGLLTITAQMPPVGDGDSKEVRLEVRGGNAWQEVGKAGIDLDARTATIRVPEWDDARDTPYRLVYALTMPDGKPRDHYWTGTVHRDPVDEESLVVAAFTGNSDPAFPNIDVVKHVGAHDPDLLFFSGDQIYENVGGYGVERTPVDRAMLDYLRKWYVYGWSFGDLMRDRPCVSIPDDHDVYQGNLWGAGGRKTDRDHNGGYVMPPEWVNMVQRTQTSNLPPPYDPTPVEQGITVYYTDVNYGRVSFAVLEDRKFKSGCNGLVPPTTAGRPDHVIDPDFDPKTADVPGAKLLGDRQLKFLREWAADWRGADFKVALSQTVFANAATHHGGNGRYLVADYDSNGWPQTGRAKALHEIRRGFGFMIAGDQHLATLIHHGIDDWNDAGWSFLVPSVTNFYLRAWLPKKPAHKQFKDMPPYTGEYLDGFGNKLAVWAATNPEKSLGIEPDWLHSKKPGYGIVRLNKKTRQITMECWPRYVDPDNPSTGKQYEGWPKTIDQLDNYGRAAAAYLPTLKVTGMTNPVVQIVDEADGEIVYTVRISGAEFRPKVFREGTYTIEVGEQPDRMKTIGGVKALPPGAEQALDVEL